MFFLIDIVVQKRQNVKRNGYSVEMLERSTLPTRLTLERWNVKTLKPTNLPTL